MRVYWDNGKENGNYGVYRGYKEIVVVILGLYRDNGKENGNYREYTCYIGVISGQWKRK